MTDTRRHLIEDLVADLKPVSAPGRIGRSLALWLSAAMVYSIVMLLVTGPLREGAIGNLIRYPFFGLESLVALIAIGSLAHAALRLAIPGATTPGRALLAPIVLLIGWVSFYIVGFWAPAHPVSILGARDYCIWQTVLFSLPNLLLLLVLARRLVPVWPATTAALAGAAGAAIPGALMQFGCMYIPGHILTHHLSPTLMLAVIGAAVGRLVLTRRPIVPRSRGVRIH
jgi:hypothetical protein